MSKQSVQNMFTIRKKNTFDQHMLKRKRLKFEEKGSSLNVKSLSNENVTFWLDDDENVSADEKDQIKINSKESLNKEDDKDSERKNTDEVEEDMDIDNMEMENKSKTKKKKGTVIKLSKNIDEGNKMKLTKTNTAETVKTGKNGEVKEQVTEMEVGEDIKGKCKNESYKKEESMFLNDDKLEGLETKLNTKNDDKEETGNNDKAKEAFQT